MKKYYKKMIFLFAVNILLIGSFIFVLNEGNKLGIFYEVNTGEISHFYIPNNIIYIKGDHSNLNAVMSLEKNNGSSAFYLSDNEVFNQDEEDFFLKFSNIISVPIDIKENELLQTEYYEFSIPISGEYEIWFSNKDTLILDKDKKLIFDNQDVKKTAFQTMNERWILWNKIHLNTGQHKILLKEENIFTKLNKPIEIILRLKLPNNLNSYPLKFAKTNSAKYEVRIENLNNNSFPLVFLEGFNKDWKIFRTTKNDKQYIWSNWFKSSISDQNHYLVNGFSNIWWIDGGSQANNEIFVIEFIQQKNLYIGLFIAFLVLLICINYLLIKEKSLCLKK